MKTALLWKLKICANITACTGIGSIRCRAYSFVSYSCFQNYIVEVDVLEECEKWPVEAEECQMKPIKQA